MEKTQKHPNSPWHKIENWKRGKKVNIIPICIHLHPFLWSIFESESTYICSHTTLVSLRIWQWIVLLPQTYQTLADCWLSCLDPLAIQRLFNYLAFKYFGFKRTWWRLFQKHVACTNRDNFVCIVLHLVHLHHQSKFEDIKVVIRIRCQKQKMSLLFYCLQHK